MTEQFQIESAEGLPIRCTLELPESPKALVIVIHGFKGFRQWGFFPWICEELAAKDIAACRFDMSRNGMGEDGETFDRLDLFADDTYSTQISDLNNVVRHLVDRPDLQKVPLFLLGHSRGGGVAMLSATTTPHLEGVVTWSAISTIDRWDEKTLAQWRRDGKMIIMNSRTGQEMPMSTAILDDYEANRDRFDILAAARRMTVPLLVIHGAKDESVPVQEARRIAEVHDNASLLIVAGASHTYGAIHPMVHVPKELQLALGVTIRFITLHW